jgi:hypothetical protein
VGPRAGLDTCGKSRPPPPHRDSIPRPSVHPVASRYTDYASRPTYLCIVLPKISVRSVAVLISDRNLIKVDFKAARLVVDVLKELV